MKTTKKTPKLKVALEDVIASLPGHIYWLDRNNKGKIIGILGISFDISDIKQKEKALVLSQKHAQFTLQTIISLLPANVYWKDLNGVYLGCNNKQASLLKFKSPNEIIGKTDYDLVKKHVADTYRKNDSKIMATGKSGVFEETWPEGNEEKTYISSKHPLTNEQGNITAILGVSFDITERKKTEQQLRDIRERSQIDKIATIQSLGDSIAHELRTPLNSISSIANNFTTQLPKLLDAYELAKQNNLPIKKIRGLHMDLLKEAAQNITKEIHFSNTMIDMLLMNIKEINIDINTFELCSATTCVKNALEQYPLANEEKKLISFKNSEDFIFRGNASLIIHTLYNLIKNALYYLTKAQKGKIVIWLESDKQQNRLHFKDTGCGIPKDILPKIFENFFSKTHGGTGVGLSSCKTVMTGLGGDITCRSQQNKFTEFVLIFPKI